MRRRGRALSKRYGHSMPRWPKVVTGVAALGATAMAAPLASTLPLVAANAAFASGIAGTVLLLDAFIGDDDDGDGKDEGES